MKRREFVAGLAGAAAWPIAARAQTDRVRRIGVLMGARATPLGEAYVRAFLARLNELGWKNGQTAIVELRWWVDDPDQMRETISELLALTPDVVMAFSNLAVALLKPLAAEIPIVFVGVGDPLGDGFVASLARPGGTITGFAGSEGPMGRKWFEVLKVTAPHVRRVLAVIHPETPVHQAFWKSIKEAAPQMGVEVSAASVHNEDEVKRAIVSFAADQHLAVSGGFLGRIVSSEARGPCAALFFGGRALRGLTRSAPSVGQQNRH